MSRKDKKGSTYIFLNDHPDQDIANYIGYAEEKFESDDEAIEFYQNSFMNNGDATVVKVIATTRSTLTKVEKEK